MWFIGVEVEQETSAPPPNKYPGSAPESGRKIKTLRAVVRPGEIQDEDAGFFSFLREKTHAF